MLEKILEEINDLPIIYDMDDGNLLRYADVEEIIRKHMNDGWIPCEERLPEYLGWKIKVWMTVANGHVVEGFYDREGFKFKNGQKIRITVRAWKERQKPEPYRPEKGEETC